MRITEIMNEDFTVKQDNPNELVLIDDNGIETKVPKDQNKPIAIQQNEKGEEEIDMDNPHGKVDQVKPGDVIKSKKPKNNAQNNKHRQHGSHSKPTGQSNTTQGTQKPQGIM